MSESDYVDMSGRYGLGVNGLSRTGSGDIICLPGDVTSVERNWSLSEVDIEAVPVGRSMPYEEFVEWENLLENVMSRNRTAKLIISYLLVLIILLFILLMLSLADVI